VSTVGTKRVNRGTLNNEIGANGMKTKSEKFIRTMNWIFMIVGLGLMVSDFMMGAEIWERLLSIAIFLSGVLNLLPARNKKKV